MELPSGGSGHMFVLPRWAALGCVGVESWDLDVWRRSMSIHLTARGLEYEGAVANDAVLWPGRVAGVAQVDRAGH